MSSLSSTQAYIAFGGNVAPKLGFIAQAIGLVSSLGSGIRLSNLYESTAVPSSDGESYYNGMLTIETTLSPMQLLITLKEIEHRVGRKVAPRNAPREIDLDIIFYGDQTLCTHALTVPHPAATSRDFVLRPLQDIIGEAPLPVDGRTTEQLLDEIMHPSVTKAVLTAADLAKAVGMFTVTNVCEISPINLMYELHLTGLRLNARIGVFDFERSIAQGIQIDLRILARRDPGIPADHLDKDLDYNRIYLEVTSLVGSGHIDTVESLGDQIADICLRHPRRIACKIRIGKTEIYENCDSVGCHIHRVNLQCDVLDRVSGADWTRRQ